VDVRAARRNSSHCLPASAIRTAGDQATGCSCSCSCSGICREMELLCLETNDGRVQSSFSMRVAAETPSKRLTDRTLVLDRPNLRWYLTLDLNALSAGDLNMIQYRTHFAMIFPVEPCKQKRLCRPDKRSVQQGNFNGPEY
jgi:hypothetical protein